MGNGLTGFCGHFEAYYATRPAIWPRGFTMPMLDDNSQLEASEAPLEGGSEPRQRRQMVAALALLLVALALVLIKDRQFWFPSAPETEAGNETETSTQAQSQASRSSFPPAQSSSKPMQHAAKSAPAPAPPVDLAPVVTNRAVLPALEIEVVAGDEHRLIKPGGTSIKVDLQPGTPATPAQAGTGGDRVAAAAERVRLSPDATQVVTHSVEPNYPLLAKQMKVQGAVVLQALIGKEGAIQDLQVISGPTILSSAAREAVKQWRFKPYFQAGQAVETEARITVNFTISTY